MGAGFGSFPAALAASRETASGKGLSFAAGVLVLPAPSDAALAASRETASGKGLSFAAAVLVVPGAIGCRLGGRIPGNGFRKGIFIFCRRLLGGSASQAVDGDEESLESAGGCGLGAGFFCGWGAGASGMACPVLLWADPCACAEALAANVSRAANEATIVSLLRIVAALSLDLRLRPFHRAVVLKK